MESFKENFETANPEVKLYYRKMVQWFAQAVSEIGMANSLSLVKEILEEDVKVKQENLRVAAEALDHTMEAIKEFNG